MPNELQQVTFTKRRSFKISQPLAEQMLAAGITAVDCEITSATPSTGAIYTFTPGNGNIGSWNVEYSRRLTRNHKPACQGALIIPRWNGDFGPWPLKTPETVLVEVIPDRSGGRCPIQAIRFGMSPSTAGEKNNLPELPVHFEVEIKPSGYVTLGRDAARYMASRGDNFAKVKVSEYGKRILKICPMYITPGTEKTSMYLCPLHYGKMNESVLIKTCDWQSDLKNRTVKTIGYWSETSGEINSSLYVNTYGPQMDHPDPKMQQYKGMGHRLYRTDRSTKTDF